MKARDFVKGGKFYVWSQSFAILQSTRIYPGAFANVLDRKEITVVIDQTQFREEDALRVQKDFKIITFDAVLPFGTYGFLARISKALAEEKIGVFAISAYTTDHILVKKKDLKKAVKRLRKLGMHLTRAND